jgi:hypothetical protein
MDIWNRLWLFGIGYGYLEQVMVIWHSLWLFGIVYNYLVYFIVNWYILWLLDIFSHFLVCHTNKNLATPRASRRLESH